MRRQFYNFLESIAGENIKMSYFKKGPVPRRWKITHLNEQVENNITSAFHHRAEGRAKPLINCFYILSHSLTVKSERRAS